MLLVFPRMDLAPADPVSRIQTISVSRLKTMIQDERDGFFMVVMAAWCGPCIEELPDLLSMHEKYRNKGFKLLAICVDYNGPGAMQPIVDKYKVTFPVYWVGEKAVDEWSILRIPLLMVVREGKIVERTIGRKSRAFLEKRILEFLKNTR